ncbi:formin-like protein 5 isoform X1 [Strigops habroptila]|uniref:formin-like protein 5 isoform X1 n=1 Tax=Strigops habroptila TaxID=2489341 RepID=UPI0011CF3D75|nr:formin-like protein 5 isoform X1 [Strigops habroptila]
MAALADRQGSGGAAVAAIRPPPPPRGYILMSGCKRPGHGSRGAAGKMAAVSAPYAKYPPPPPLRPPGGKGKRVGFKPPPPPAQTPSSLCPCPELVTAATITPATPRTAGCSHQDRTGSDLRRPAFQPGGSATRLPHRIGPAPHNGPPSPARSCRPANGTAGSRLPAKYRSLRIPPPLKPSATHPLCRSGGCPEQGPGATPPRTPSLLLAPKGQTPPDRLNFKNRFFFFTSGTGAKRALAVTLTWAPAGRCWAAVPGGGPTPAGRQRCTSMHIWRPYKCYQGFLHKPAQLKICIYIGNQMYVYL